MRTSHLLMLAAMVGCNGAPPADAPSGTSSDAVPTELTEKLDRVSYAIGYDIGQNFQRQGIEGIDTKVLEVGLKHGMTEGSTPLLSEEDMAEVTRQFREEMREAAMAKRKTEADENQKAGEAYLAANATKEGVQTTESGLQYKVLTKGEGPVPKNTDRVKVHYAGKLIDGTEFDSSIARGQPASFRVSGVIKGWTEALEMMPVGSKWELYIPGDLAYGQRGSPPKIGPNSVLVFEVELLEIEK